MGVIKSLLSNENFHLLMSVCRMVCYKHPYSFHPQTITTTLSSQPSFNTIYIFWYRDFFSLFIISGTRKVQTLYTPNDAKVETTVIESHDVFFPQQSLEQELRKSLATSNNIDDDGVIICGSNDTISKSYIDIVPDINSINLPFGSTTHSQEDLLRTNQDASTPLSDINISVSKSTTSVTQGKVHVVKDIGNGTISIATTTFCGISHSVMSTASQEGTKPNTR